MVYSFELLYHALKIFSMTNFFSILLYLTILPAIMTRSHFSPVFFLLVFIGFKSFCQNPQQVGQWSPKIVFDIVPVAVANLPDGKLVTWSSKYHHSFGGDDGFTYTQIFDPLGGIEGKGGVLPRTVTNTNHDMFCPGINNLADGRLLVSGGSSAERTSIYDPKTGEWSRAADLNIPRGYQGAVTLSDGSAFTIGGSWSGNSTYGGRDGEHWTEATGWKRLTGLKGELLWNTDDFNGEVEGEYRLDNHAWMWAAPNGKIFHAGPGEEMHWIDVSGNGSSTPAGKRGDDRESMNGNAVMFDIGKILKVGGSRSYSSDTPSNDKSYVIDINNGDVVTVNSTANKMAHSRIYVSSVVLPNGEVLIMGGMEKAVVFSDNGAHLSAEMYNPTTNRFRTLANMEVPRTYHSAGILLNDGRVFMGGGGLCGEHCAANHKDGEIFSPPYLFNSAGGLATRPTLSAPDKAFYGAQLPVAASPDVTEFAFLRMSSATHSVNNEQRRVPVTYTGSNGNFTLNMPNANVMPPGYYMLFAINGAGVPSISEAVLVGKPDDKIQGDNLLVEFDFFEGSGALVTDLSGKNNHGTIKERDNSGNAIPLSIEYWSADGLSGNALKMNGIEHSSNTILEVPASPSLLALKDEITVMAWVNRDIGSVVTQNNNAIPNVAVFNYDYPRSFFMGYHGNQYKLEFWTKSGGTASIYHTGKRYTPGIWEHLVATYDGATAILYVNGEELQRVTVSGDLKINDESTVFNNFTLSGFYDNRTKSSLPSRLPSYSNASGITDELDGRMDKFKLYDVSLTIEEIQRIYNDEVRIVKNENPCDDVVLAYNINGKKDSGAQELSLRQGDNIELFVEGENADFVVKSIIGPGNQILSSAVINNMQPNQSGTYRINYTIKETDLAQDLKVDGVSSFMDNRFAGGNFYYPGLRAVDGRTDTYWSTPWVEPGMPSVPSHPHWITIDLGAESNVSGLDYLPRFNGGFLYGTIKDYEIYVFNSVSAMGSAVKTGTWVYDKELKKVTFPEKKGRYVRLVALSEGGSSGGSTQATAAEIRIRTTKNTECFKDIVITAHAPRTFTYNEGWATNPGNPSGVSNKYDNIVINAGTEAIISENTSLDNLIIEEGAALTVETNVILTFNTITLNSTSTSFPSLIDKGWIAGEVNYNRYINRIGASAGGGNDLISSPVTGMRFDAYFVSNNPKLAENESTLGVFAFAPYNVTAGAYENFNIGTDYSGSIPLETGAGYRVATTDGSPLNFRGQITRNPLTISITDASQGNAWNLIGNPYPSYIDFEAFFTANAAEFDSRNAYQAIYGYTGMSNKWTVWNNATIVDPNIQTTIAPGQGFFVKSKPGGGVVKFMPEMRTTGTSDDFILGRQVKRNVALSKLKLSSAKNNEVTSIYFIEGTTKGMDSGYDAATFSGTSVDFSIATSLLEDATSLNFAIQSLPYDDFNDVVVPLVIKSKAGEELSIGIEEGSTLPSNITVYLEDAETNTFTSLTAKPYTFTSKNLNSANRFYVHYSSKSLSVEDMQSDDNLRIYTIVVPKALVIRGPLSSATTANLYDIQGRLVLSKVLNPHSSENTVDISRVTTGVYVVKVSTDNQFKTQKVIIK